MSVSVQLNVLNCRTNDADNLFVMNPVRIALHIYNNEFREINSEYFLNENNPDLFLEINPHLCNETQHC